MIYLALPILFIAAISIWRVFGAREVVVGLLVLSTMFLPRTVFAFGEREWHVGMASPNIAITTYLLAILAALLYVAARRIVDWRFVAAFIPLYVYMGFMMTFFWPSGETRTWSGLVHLSTAVCAFVIGASLRETFDPKLKGSRTVARWLVIVMAIQLPIVGLQLVGLQLFPTDAATELYEGDRPNGSFGHPSTWGKLVILSLLLLLPLTRSSDRATRRLAVTAIVLAVPTVLASASRANFLALVLALVFWVIVIPSTRNLGRRLLVPFATLVVILLSLDLWVARFETGEDGSVRAYLLDVGLRVLSESWLTGVGANSYIPYAATIDRTALDGWPVHNTFVFLSSELGIVGALLLLWPLIWLLLRSISLLRTPSSAGDFARAFLVTLPGVLVISMTGWGMTAESLPLWLFTLGVAAAQMTSPGPTGVRNARTPRYEVTPSRP